MIRKVIKEDDAVVGVTNVDTENLIVACFPSKEIFILKHLNGNAFWFALFGSATEPQNHSMKFYPALDFALTKGAEVFQLNNYDDLIVFLKKMKEVEK
jgi:hypothetical protein